MEHPLVYSINAEWFYIQLGLAVILAALTVVAYRMGSSRFLRYVGFAWMYTQTIFLSWWGAGFLAAETFNVPAPSGLFQLLSILLGITGSVMCFRALSWGWRIVELREVVRLLLAKLGPTLVAALSGTRDSTMPEVWARDAGPLPSDEEQARMRFALEMWNELAAHEGPDVARAWFLGGNSRLNEDTPITAIREDRFKRVVIAVNDQIFDQFD